MRTFAFLAVVTSFFAAHHATAQAPLKSQPAAPAWQAILAAQAEGDSQSDKRQFLFACSSPKKNSKFLHSFSKEKVDNQKIIAVDGKSAKLESVSQRPFVTGVETVGKTGQGELAYQPIITAFEEGYSVELTIKSLDDSHVQLDARFSFTTIGEVDEVAVGECNTQAPTSNTVSQRLVRTVLLGEKLQLEIPQAGTKTKLVVDYSIDEL